jgi:hypothetical protein
MRRPTGRLRLPLAGDDAAAAAAVGTILLVVITVAMMVVIGVFVFSLVEMPEDPPEMQVSYSHLNNRWSASIRSTTEEAALSSMRILVRDPGGAFVSYDTDGDAVPDTLMVWDLADIAVSKGDGPQPAPVIFVDSNEDGKVNVGDSIVAYGPYYYPVGPLMDADRGYKLVGLATDFIPRDSDLFVVASPVTLGNDDIDGGDTIRVEIKDGATVMATIEGPASLGGVYEDNINIPVGWTIKNYDAVFTIRPGEVDEWSVTFSFRVSNTDPITPTEAATYHNSTHPVGFGTVITIIHKPSNSVSLEYKL